MKIDRIINRTLSLVVGGLLTVSLSGCLDDNSACIEDQPGYKEGNDVWLSFKVSNMGESSRTRAEGDEPSDGLDHPDETASEAENYINLKDFTVILFNDQQRLWKIVDPDEILNFSSTNGSDNKEYEFAFKINKAYFDYAGDSQNITFSLMAIANSSGLGQGYDSFKWNLLGLTPEELANQYRSFTMPDQSNNPWKPSTDQSGIPMTGIMTSNINRVDLDAAEDRSHAVDFGTIHMQRCLAKIRVLDAIPDDVGQIKSVTLTGGNNKGAFIPTVDKDWFSNTRVVENATEKPNDDSWYNESLSVSFENTNSSFTSITNKLEYKNQFYCYVAESLVQERNTELVILVDIVGEDPKEFTVRLATAYGDSYKGISNIARNHIYEYIIDINQKSQLNINYTVCPWVTKKPGDISFN